MSLDQIIPPVVKPNTEISISVSKNNNLTNQFYSNGSIVYYAKEGNLNKTSEIFQLYPLQSNAAITAMINITIPNTKRNMLFTGDSQGKLTVIELFLEAEEKFKIVKEIQVFNAIISEIAVDNTGYKVFVSGALNLNSNSRSFNTGDTLLRFLNWELGNSVGDPMGLNGAATALTFASGIKAVVDFRVTVADSQGTLIFFSGSDNGTGYKFIKTFKDSNTQYRGVIKDVKYSPSSDDDAEKALATFGAFQRSKQGVPVRGKYLVACYSDKRLKLFNGDDGSFINDIISDKEIDNLSDIKGGWSLINWVSSETFIVSGRCGSRIYHINDQEVCELVYETNKLQLQGLSSTNNELVGIQEDGSLLGLELFDNYLGFKETHLIKGINKAIDCFSEDLVSTVDGQIYNFKKQIIYLNDDKVQVVLLKKISDNEYISLNKVGTLTQFKTENGVKKIIKQTQLNAEVLIAEFDANNNTVTFVDFEYNVGIVDLSSGLIEKVLINKEKEEITAISNVRGKVYIATFNQQKQTSKIQGLDDNLLEHKAKISQFILDDRFITFSDFTGKTQVQSLQDDLIVQEKSFDKGDIIVSVNKWSHHSGKITSMAWKPCSIENLSLSASEPLLATVGLDNSLVVYSLKKTIKPKLKIENCHKIGIIGVLWISENKIATFGLDGSVKYWKL
ncbi:hypothetical protein QEN19_002714 [Hanseniaspora menglaensis]